MSRALGELGLFDYDRTLEPPPLITTALDRGIRAFQHQDNLRKDGIINPGGETVLALKRATGGGNKSAGGTEPACGKVHHGTLLTGFRYVDEDAKDGEDGDGEKEPEENPCQAIEDTYNSIIDDIMRTRQKISNKNFQIAEKCRN